MADEAESGSITALLERMKGGDHEAVHSLWQRYYPRLVSLARKKLQGTPRLVADEEDVALSAFDSFCRRAEQGQFPDLNDRDSLWTLLVLLISRKSADLARYHSRSKRGGSSASMAAPDQTIAAAGSGGMDELQGEGPTPEEAALFAEAVAELLARLPNDALRQVAVWKMEGFTNADIAARQGCSVPTIERRLGLIRRLLKHE